MKSQPERDEPGDLALLDQLLAPQGWPHASTLPIDEEDPGRFHALFGRDSLVTALQILPARPEVARATLRALADLQGQEFDAETAEEPGKIIHEYRPRGAEDLAARGFPVRNGVLRYYASADSTAWFLIVLAALGDAALEDELHASWEAAGEWLVDALVRGGGFVRHAPATNGGLVQQGWRDTVDPRGRDGSGILNSDLTVPHAPLADADTQAVAAVALSALSVLKRDPRLRDESAALGNRIERVFSSEAMAIDASDKPVVGAGSQLGWLLWSGVLSARGQRLIAGRLVEPDILTPWGLRTLCTGHPAFSPDAYHRGTVWPFDSWIGEGGLRAAGRTTEAEIVRSGVLRAVERLGYAPELYEVHESGPRRSSLSNQVQALTIGARWALESGWDGRPPRLFEP